jgi:EmrB/QacA subfamily drug resistance transporter
MTTTSIPNPETNKVPGRGLILAVLLAGAFMILLDATIVNVAVPRIQTGLHATYASVEWVIGGYALAYGLMLIPIGRLGDRIGHKPVLLAGLAGFTITSLLCGTAQSPDQLVGWRLLQGVMAGVLNPPVLALIQSVFPPRERGKAFAAYGATAGVSTALGPLLGGLLISANPHGWDWRPIFLINLPIGLITLIATIRLVPNARGRGGSLDLVGVALISVAMLMVTYPLVQGRDAGWPAWMFVCMAASLPMLGLFAAWEAFRIRRDRVPLVDIRLFGNRSFSAGVGLSLSFFAGFIGLSFALVLYLQLGLGRSALVAGLTMLPFPLGMLFGASGSDTIAAKIGRTVLLIGMGLVAIGTTATIAVIHYAAPDPSGWLLLAPLLVAGFGAGLFIAPNVDIVLAGVPGQDAGAASGVLNTAQRLGQAIGVAVVGVAMFGALGSGATHAATKTTTILRANLAATGLSGPAADAAMRRFVRCFHTQANASDPTVTPPHCTSVSNDSDSFERAASAALKDNFGRAVQIGSLYALGAIVLTFCLVFVLPRRRAEVSEW